MTGGLQHTCVPFLSFSSTKSSFGHENRADTSATKYYKARISHSRRSPTAPDWDYALQNQILDGILHRHDVAEKAKFVCSSQKFIRVIEAKKSSPKNSWNQINQFHEILFLKTFLAGNIQKTKSVKLNYLISRVFWPVDGHQFLFPAVK